MASMTHHHSDLWPLCGDHVTATHAQHCVCVFKKKRNSFKKIKKRRGSRRPRGGSKAWERPSKREAPERTINMAVVVPPQQRLGTRFGEYKDGREGRMNNNEGGCWSALVGSHVGVSHAQAQAFSFKIKYISSTCFFFPLISIDFFFPFYDLLLIGTCPQVGHFV